MINERREQWIDDVLNSTAGMARATPGEGFFERVQAGLGSSRGVVSAFPVKKWAVAAAVMLMLNVGSILYYAHKSGPPVAQGSAFSEIETVTTYNY